uniref:Uncharacterized protein n=1 Tax=Oryza nivara TaxID=4536 RepID=A0A0E0GN57_ORYNI
MARQAIRRNRVPAQHNFGPAQPSTYYWDRRTQPALLFAGGGVLSLPIASRSRAPPVSPRPPPPPTPAAAACGAVLSVFSKANNLILHAAYPFTSGGLTELYKDC